MIRASRSIWGAAIALQLYLFASTVLANTLSFDLRTRTGQVSYTNANLAVDFWATDAAQYQEAPRLWVVPGRVYLVTVVGSGALTTHPFTICTTAGCGQGSISAPGTSVVNTPNVQYNLTIPRDAAPNAPIYYYGCAIHRWMGHEIWTVARSAAQSSPIASAAWWLSVSVSLWTALSSL